MIFSTLNKNWVVDDTPQLFEGVIDDPSKFATWKEVEHCLNFPCFYDIQFIDRVRSGTFNIPKYPRAWARDSEDPEELFNIWKEGHGLIINNFDRGFKEKQKILGEVEKTFHGVTAMHVYAGLMETQSFHIHEDYTSNFIVQVEGETLWTVYKNKCSDLVKDRTLRQLEGYNAEGIEIALQHKLKPGDMIYIPRRTYHQAKPDNKRLSVSIAIEHHASVKPTDRKYYKLAL